MNDLAAHADQLRALIEDPREPLRGLFSAGNPIMLARAPGRLDVMGGIGDYSGSLVLEMPIAQAAYVAAQKSRGGGVCIVASPEQLTGELIQATLSADQWLKLMRSDYETARRILQDVPHAGWVAYVLGPVLTLMRETPARLDGGLRILIVYGVPMGKGVSSSAAVEVATMRAVAALAEHEMAGEEIARLCQLAENRVVGAPCGIMDQMTSALGRENQLLALLCQPATVEGYVAIPEGVAFWGVDSGIRHAVSGSDYTSVRTGAFMGYRILAELAGLEVKPAGDVPGAMVIDDPIWNGYAANVTPAEFRARFAEAVPREMSGSNFLARYGGITDTVTWVDPARTYAVREPLLHPIGENERAHRFRELLRGEITDAALREMGALMYAAHASYSACGLGSDGTDLLVELVRARGPASGLYGAKITGGGSGGTVAILGRADAGPAVDELASEYTRRSGRETYIFHGSSPGAWATEVMEVTT